MAAPLIEGYGQT